MKRRGNAGNELHKFLKFAGVSTEIRTRVRTHPRTSSPPRCRALSPPTPLLAPYGRHRSPPFLFDSSRFFIQPPACALFTSWLRPPSPSIFLPFLSPPLTPRPGLPVSSRARRTRLACSMYGGNVCARKIHVGVTRRTGLHVYVQVYGYVFHTGDRVRLP